MSGEITPDRYVLDKYSSNLCYQQLTEQTHKFVRSSNVDGVEKVEIESPTERPVLSRNELKVRGPLYRDGRSRVVVYAALTKCSFISRR